MAFRVVTLRLPQLIRVGLAVLGDPDRGASVFPFL